MYRFATLQKIPTKLHRELGPIDHETQRHVTKTKTTHWSSYVGLCYNFHLYSIDCNFNKYTYSQRMWCETIGNKHLIGDVGKFPSSAVWLPHTVYFVSFSCCWVNRINDDTHPHFSITCDVIFHLTFITGRIMFGKKAFEQPKANNRPNTDCQF